jgi:PIN domain nuclease of toxin-antitoxin system
MKLLLDTHIWRWSVLEPVRLSKRATRALGNPANELWVSPISTWELLLLCRKGRVYGLTLVTADDNLLNGSGYQVMANR